jgi:head-tail adaptor
MLIGKMNKRIAIYKTNTISDGAGGFEKSSDELICTVWGAIINKQRSVGLESGAFTIVNTKEITIRRLNFDISRGYFLKICDEVFGIETVIQDDFHNKIIATNGTR